MQSNQTSQRLINAETKQERFKRQIDVLVSVNMLALGGILACLIGGCIVGVCDAEETTNKVKALSNEAEIIRLIEQLKLANDKQQQQLDKQELEMTMLRRAVQAAKGSTYVRWGRTTCEGDAVALYRGHAAGANHLHGGSGSNLLCLHDSPQWNKYLPGHQGPTSRIYGVEYEIFAGERGINNNVFSLANNGGRPILDHPAPCTLCYVPTRTAKAMIPARNDCPIGWTREYSGYIVSEFYLRPNGRLNYLCWDGAPEVAAGGTGQSQAVFYPTEVMCGSLPCSKFPDGLELTCVVCTK